MIQSVLHDRQLRSILLWYDLCSRDYICQIYFYYYYYYSFFTSANTDGLPLELEWQKVSSSLHNPSQYCSILNNAVVWMVSTRLPSSKPSSPFSNPLVTVPNALITIGIIVTFMFHRFFNSLASSRYLSFFSHSFSFILRSAETANSTVLQVLLFWGLLVGMVFWPRLGDPCVCQSPRGVYVCYFLWQVLCCAYTMCSCGQI